MSNELAKIEFNKEQIDLIKSQVAPKATDNELKLFLYHCQRTGLDPLARQVYAIKRKAKDEAGNWIEKMTIQTSIDGFRVVAERSGSYAGQDEPVFVETETRVVCCKVTVYRFNGPIRYPAAVGVAYWNEYVPKEGQDLMWKKMPHTMLSKVAEALALRKAFPQDLSGLYTNDEMTQADTPPLDVKHEEVNTTALGADIETATKLLKDTVDFATLQATWINIPADLKPLVEKVKDEMKAKFKPVAATT